MTLAMISGKHAVHFRNWNLKSADAMASARAGRSDLFAGGEGGFKADVVSKLRQRLLQLIAAGPSQIEASRGSSQAQATSSDSENERVMGGVR